VRDGVGPLVQLMIVLTGGLAAKRRKDVARTSARCERSERCRKDKAGVIPGEESNAVQRQNSTPPIPVSERRIKDIPRRLFSVLFCLPLQQQTTVD
jgi:hypothetical protein